MRYHNPPTGKTTGICLSALAVGLLFFLTSCGVFLRDADAPPAVPPVPETAAPVNDAPRPEPAETEPPAAPEPPVYPEYERTVPAGADEWIVRYESTYGAGTADQVLLDRAGISELNRTMTAAAPNLRDMTALPASMSGAEVRSLIERYSLPADDRYVDGHTFITPEMRNDVRNNRNLDGIPETVEPRRAVITGRSDLKGFPTSKTFHKHGDRHYDGIQETELITGFPAAVLHTSTDGHFSFVLSYFYSGWIPSGNIAYCTDEEYGMFASPEDYVTVVSKTAECGGIRFDMGAVLPFVSETANSYIVLVPKRHADTGTLFLEEEVISKEDAVHGSLPFTMRNYYAQAFAYLGTYYGWGGSGGGVDCSGFVCAIFRTFGIYLPRNTGEQSVYAGTILSLTEDPYNVLAGIRQPAAVYRPGHVMLYLGMKDGVPHIIHAPQGGEQVCVTELSMANLTAASVFG